MDNISKVYEKLLSLKSTKLILDDGRGRKLYDVAISPAFRTKYFKYNSPQRVEGLELKTKADITGNVYEKGWVLIDNRQQLKDRQPNPRPRKYASDAERQAAYRNRASMVEFRADEKTAEKLTEIATTLDISRSDLLLSMVKFALTNHQWARFGLTHKTLPRYEENPMATKKFSPAQIAAQKLFAERARAGTLGKTVKRKAAVKRNPVKNNPVQDAGEFVMTVNGKSKTRFFVTDNDQWANSYGFDYRLLSDVTKYGSPVKFTKTRAIVAIDEGADGKPITDTWNIRGLKFYKTNPDKSKPRAYVKRVSQATGAPPSKRLVTRRKKALTAPAGYFPNPKVKYTNRAKDMQGDQRVGYAVHMADRPSYQAIAWFSKKDDAVKVAQEASDRIGKQLAVTRVQNYFGAM